MAPKATPTDRPRRDLPADLRRAMSGRLSTDLLWAAVIGAAAALLAYAFRMISRGLLWLFTHQWTRHWSPSLTQTAQDLSWWGRLLIPTAGGLLAGMILYFGMRLHRGQSAGDYMEAIAVGDGTVRVRPTIVKCLSALLSIASGASIGREGPLVQLAAMAGAIPGRLLNLSMERKRLFVACGAAAGIASAYNSPIAGAMFVAEIILGSISMEHFGPLVFSSVTATVVTRDLLGEAPIFFMPALRVQSHGELLAHLTLGALAGVMGPAFLYLLNVAKGLFARFAWPAYVKLALGGLVVGIISIIDPRVWGNGYSVVNSILHDQWLVSSLLAMLLLKVTATAATVGSGAVGGVFTPTLFVGAVLGAIVGSAMNKLFPAHAAPVAMYAMVGMGAFLAATTHAPILAILMLFEMTLDYAIVLPLMLACVVAYYVARGINPDSIYSESLRRKAAGDDGSMEYWL